MKTNVKRLVRAIAIVTVLLVSGVFFACVAASSEKPIETITLHEYILSCYDSEYSGFSDYPGGESSLETTLDARAKR